VNCGGVAPFRELAIDVDTAELLVSMSAATIDRRWPMSRAKYHSGPCLHQAGDRLLKSQFRCAPGLTGTMPDPGSSEIDLVGHDGGNPLGLMRSR